MDTDNEHEHSPPPATVRQVSRDDELFTIRARQPYSTEIAGVSLHVDKDVFPPDLGYTSKYLAEVLEKYSPTSALDMGCGTAFLAILLRKRNGAKLVWAVDIHEPAVACSKVNCARNDVTDIIVRESDLFGAVDEGVRFDLIVFNQPYYPSTKEVVFGLGFDGGRAIITRFLEHVRAYLTPNAVVIMPFSSIASSEHDPSPLAQAAGFKCEAVFKKIDAAGTHVVYEMRDQSSPA